MCSYLKNGDCIDQDNGDKNDDFRNIDDNLDTAFLAWATYEAEKRDHEDAESLVMDLRLPDEEQERRQPFPNFNDRQYSQNIPTGTFRATKVSLRDLVGNSEVDWDIVLTEHFEESSN